MKLDKKKAQIIAAKHHELMVKTMTKETALAVQNTTEHTWENTPGLSTIGNRPIVSIKEIDTVEAITEEKKQDFNLRVTALNFASFKNPGGGFLKGAVAQEESLCHYSNLYEILSEHNNWYVANRSRQNGGLYEDRLLYTKGVTFGVEDIWRCTCDIITCAAPNRRRALEVFDDVRIYKTLLDRCKLILSVVDSDILILGAWGCGVFGNRPDIVARAFQTILELYTPKVFRIVFAIPGPEKTVEAFKRRLL